MWLWARLWVISICNQNLAGEHSNKGYFVPASAMQPPRTYVPAGQLPAQPLSRKGLHVASQLVMTATVVSANKLKEDEKQTHGVQRFQHQVRVETLTLDLRYEIYA